MIDNKTLLAGGLIIAILTGVVAVFLASSDPDGLESTALIIQGGKTLTGPTPPDAEIVENMDGKFAYSAPMPDYSLGEGSGSMGGILAIVGGTLFAFLVAIGLIYALKVSGKKNPPKANQ
ncbi:MAG: PDGLE domain-containing protein [Methanomicrobiales archaeon]